MPVSTKLTSLLTQQAWTGPCLCCGAYDGLMTFVRNNTITKTSLIVAGGLTLFALAGCASPEPEGRNFPIAKSPSSSAAGNANNHLDVSADFEPASDWTVIKESDRTKPDGTEVHNIRWDTGDKLLTVDDIKVLFDENGYTVTECFEQIRNCTGAAPIEGGTVKVSMTGTAWTDSQTKELDRNELAFETSPE